MFLATNLWRCPTEGAMVAVFVSYEELMRSSLETKMTSGDLTCTAT